MWTAWLLLTLNGLFFTLRLAGNTGSFPRALTRDEEQDCLNQMWRNHCVSDTYEPGSTFKIITTCAALEEHVVSPDDSFYCPGYIVVEDRRIRCHRTQGHGAENFVQGIENSCNPGMS